MECQAKAAPVGVHSDLRCVSFSYLGDARRSDKATRYLPSLFRSLTSRECGGFTVLIIRKFLLNADILHKGIYLDKD